MSEEKIVYLGLFLTPDSRMLLDKVIPHHIHPNLLLDHVTLVFRPTDEQIKALQPLVGKDIPFTAVEYFWDEMALAVGVHLPKLPVVTPQHGHVTMYLADGVSPKYSKELMENTLPMPMSYQVLSGVMDSFPRGLLAKWKVEPAK